MCIDSAIARDIIVSIAAVATAAAAWFGLKEWKHELREKTNFDVARRLIRSVYEIRDSVESCRAPFIRGGEYPKKYQSKTNLTSKEEAEAYGYVFQNRWRPVQSAMQEFNAQSLEAEALWGDGIRKQADKIFRCLQELKYAISEVIEDKMSGGNYFKGSLGHGKEMRSVVFSGIDPKKEFSKQLAGEITGIENKIRPYLQRR